MTKKKIAEMDKIKTGSENAIGRHKRAEEKVRAADAKAAKKLSPKEIRKTLHELRVHQIELEMQNEELRLTQAELDAARARYFDLYDLAPVGYCTLSETGMILEANQTAVTMLDMTRGALVKQLLTRFIHKEDQDIYYLQRKQLFETHSTSSGQAGKQQTFELRMVKKDGTVFWAHLTATVEQNADGVSIAPGYRVVISDISERKRAEAELRESEERYKTLFDEALDGTCLADAETGLIIDCNQALAELVGRERAELIGQSQRILHPPYANQAAYSLTFRQHLTDKEGQILETQIVTRAGIIREVEIKANRLNLQGRKMLQGIFRDITVRKQIESQREAALEALRAKNEELERFTYSVSHDLKSPLVTIRTFLGQLENDMDVQDNEKIKEDIDYIGNGAEKMSRLLDELLNLSRVGRKMNPPEEVSLQSLVQEASALVAGRISKHGVKVAVGSADLMLSGDRPRLIEVFQNLLDNACKFMGTQKAPLIEIGVESKDGEAIIFVRDNGMGIDQKFLARLFIMFEKLDRGTEGDGIGLALVKRIVEVHGGRIWAESDGHGQGATFRFTLQHKLSADAGGGSSLSVPPGPGRSSAFGVRSK